MKRKLFCLFVLVILSSCAHQPTSYSSDAPGFFMGLVHGYIAIIALIVGFFTDVRIYNVPNTGYWYDVGFIIGVSGFIGSAASN